MSVATRRPPRAVLAEHAQALRELGMLQREIADLLGVSRSYAAALMGNDPLGERDRERKKGYGGTCINCSGPTDGSNGRAKVPQRCSPCQIAFQRTEEYKVSIQVWSRELLLDRIREWAALYGEPPGVADWNPYQARRVLHDEERARRWEEADGHWPWFMTVIHRFGSWNAAVAEAGFVPRSGNGGGGNHLRRRRSGRRAAA